MLLAAFFNIDSCAVAVSSHFLKKFKNFILAAAASVSLATDFNKSPISNSNCCLI